MNRKIFAAFVAGVGVAASVGAWAGGHIRGFDHAGMESSPAELSAHVDHMLKHLYVEIDATDAQQARIGPLVQQAVDDVLPLREQLRTAHAQVLDALTQPSVDRSALEAARAAHLQLADQASKRIVQLIADVGDLLTPAQRAALAEHLNRRKG